MKNIFYLITLFLCFSTYAQERNSSELEIRSLTIEATSQQPVIESVTAIRSTKKENTQLLKNSTLYATKSETLQTNHSTKVKATKTSRASRTNLEVRSMTAEKLSELPNDVVITVTPSKKRE